jgi:hypothetical protein
LKKEISKNRRKARLPTWMFLENLLVTATGRGNILRAMVLKYRPFGWYQAGSLGRIISGYILHLNIQYSKVVCYMAL